MGKPYHRGPRRRSQGHRRSNQHTSPTPPASWTRRGARPRGPPAPTGGAPPPEKDGRQPGDIEHGRPSPPRRWAAVLATPSMRRRARPHDSDDLPSGPTVRPPLPRREMGGADPTAT